MENDDRRRRARAPGHSPAAGNHAPGPRDFCGQVPGDLRDRLAQLHEREARTPGTLAYHSRLERTRPWRDLAAVLLVTALILLALAASGGSPADLGRLLLR